MILYYLSLSLSTPLSLITPPELLTEIPLTPVEILSIRNKPDLKIEPENLTLRRNPVKQSFNQSKPKFLSILLPVTTLTFSSGAFADSENRNAENEWWFLNFKKMVSDI